MAVDSISGMSGWDVMQSWSAKRAAAASEDAAQDSAMSSALLGGGSSGDPISDMLTGGSSSSSSSFMTNDTLSSSLFGSVSDNLTNEEDLMANVIRTRLAKEQAASSSGSGDELAALQQQLASLSAGDSTSAPGSLVDISA